MNPYLIETSTIISFSGGRSSGFMLWNILDAYNHKLPDDIKVVFCNTGLEHEETYNFINRLSKSWGVEIVWLEYFVDKNNKASFKIVDFETASRNGEPFSQLIKKKKYLPNPMARICTVNLKIETLNRYVKENLNWNDWNKAIGLRFEEFKRVQRMRDKEDVLLPMADAQHTKFDVFEFWTGEDIDLKLPVKGNILSNCVGCYLKSYQSLEDIARNDPVYFNWWIDTEENSGRTFRNDRPNYLKIKDNAQKQLAFDFGDTIDCFCTD